MSNAARLEGKTHRNYRIVGLCRATPRYTVMIEVEGGGPRDTGTPAADWADPLELERGVWDYFTRDEKRILRGAFNRKGIELNPRTKKIFSLREKKELGL